MSSSYGEELERAGKVAGVLTKRFFAWIQWQRRILVRWEYHARNFLGFVQFASSLSSSGDFEIGSSHFTTASSALVSITNCTRAPSDFFTGRTCAGECPSRP